MAQKNKETQTQKLLNDFSGVQQFGYGVVPDHLVCQYYMNREAELYKQACRLKGIPIRDSIKEEEEEEEPPKVVYRYTLEEMKSYNPNREKETAATTTSTAMTTTPAQFVQDKNKFNQNPFLHTYHN